MRLHTNTITEQDISSALLAERKIGRVANSVWFKTLDTKTSRTHAHAFEVQLESWGHVKGDGRRIGATGSYGGMCGTEYAATYDEWGWLIAALYRLDPEAVWGTVKSPNYSDAEDFDYKTGLSFNPTELLAYLEADGEHPAWGDPFPYVSLSQSAGRVGRRGYGRVHIDAPASTVRYTREAPRTAADVRAFAHLEPVSA